MLNNEQPVAGKVREQFLSVDSESGTRIRADNGRRKGSGLREVLREKIDENQQYNN